MARLASCERGGLEVDELEKARIEADIRGWDAIADHRTGSAGDRDTADWLATALRDAGLTPRLDEFPFDRRVLHTCAVSAAGRRADGVPLFDGGFTGAAGVQGKLGFADAAAGDIAVAAFASHGADAATRKLLETRRHGDRPVVAVSKAPDVAPGLALLNAPAYYRPFGPPVLQVATEHDGWLHEAAQDGAAANFVAHATLERTTACNVMAAVAGRDKTLAPLYVITPRSAWWTSTAERGGGIALWLACARRLAASPGARDAIFIATAGHELGHLGLARFLQEWRFAAKAARAWLHLGANFAAAGGQLRLQASPDCMPLALEAFVAEGALPDSSLPAGAQPGGEAANIHAAGGRYVSLIGAQRWFHHPQDRWPHAVDIERTERICRGLLRLAQNLAGA